MQAYLLPKPVVSFHQDLMTILIRKDIKKFITIIVVLSPICKPAQYNTCIPLQEALYYI